MSEEKRREIRCIASEGLMHEVPSEHLDKYAPDLIVTYREVLPGDAELDLEQILVQIEKDRQRHAKLVEAVMTLKVWVDLPHFDQCSPEMLKAWDLFRHIESEVGDE